MFVGMMVFIGGIGIGIIGEMHQIEMEASLEMDQS